MKILDLSQSACAAGKKMNLALSVSRVRLLVVMVIIMSVLDAVSATYMAFNKIDGGYGMSNGIEGKSEAHRKRAYGSHFRRGKNIMRYLKMYGTSMMIWRCKNAIQPYYNGKPIPVVELYCEVLGTLQAASWYRNGQKLSLDGHYGQSIMPHHANGRYYSTWIDFRLRVYDATPRDSGVYTFEAVSLDGVPQRQYIYVDISGAKKKRKDSRKDMRAEDRKLRKKQLRDEPK